MSEFLDKIGISITRTQEQSLDLLEKLIATARPKAVFGEPVTIGDYTVITATEVSCGMGMGFGGGGGDAASQEPSAEIPLEGEVQPELKTRHDLTPPPGGYGVGGGGGGVSTGRPVAAISIGPDGVHIEPVVDATKIVLAFFTAVGAMALMLSNMRQRAGR